jgi:uncharacterized Tic20 family protein
VDFHEAFRTEYRVHRGFEAAERPYVVAAHASVLLAVLFPYCGAVIGPSIIMATFGTHHRGAEAEAIEAVNFSINVSIVMCFAKLLDIVSGLDRNLYDANSFQIIGMLWFIPLVLWAVRRTRKLHPYRYPFIWRFVQHAPVSHSGVNEVDG